MNTATASIIVAVLALVGVAITQIQQRRGTDRSSDLVERAQLFDEMAGLKKEVATLRRQVRSAADYINECWVDYRRRGIDPPPIPNRAPAPWEE